MKILCTYLFLLTCIGKKTASFVLTIYKDNDSIDSMIKRADDALFQAKNNGRNQIVINL